MSETDSSLADKVRTGHRLEILNQAFRGLLAINGGGAVSLLAYLQAIEGNPQLVKAVLSGISAFSAGLVFAILFMLFRDRVSLADQFRKPSVKVFKFFEELFLYGSLLAFVVAVILLVHGYYESLES
jgi:amino acid permease